MKTVRLPPGSLGLELEASHRSLLGKQQGIRVKGWKSAIFSLSALPAESVVCRIDGVDIHELPFKEAVNLLKTSETREIEYCMPGEADENGGGKDQDKVLSATLRFQELDKENTSPNVSMSMSNSPSVGKDFWTVAKMGKKEKSPLKTRSPMRFKGVYTSPRARQAHVAANNKHSHAEDWVCIPLAEQFDNISSPQSEKKPTPPVVEEEEEEEKLVVELKKQELVDAAINTSNVVERVTPLKGKISELEANVAGKSEEINALDGAVKELKSCSRSSDGKIALLKFQLSKTIKGAGARGGVILEDEGVSDAVQEALPSPPVLAHLKMCRAIQAVRSRGLREKGTSTDVSSSADVCSGPDDVDEGTLCDSDLQESTLSEEEESGGQAALHQVWVRQLVVLQSLKEYHKHQQGEDSVEQEQMQEQVNLSSGTLHSSAIVDELVHVGVQCQVEAVDAMVGEDVLESVGTLSPTKESVATQSNIEIAVGDEEGRESAQKRMNEQDRYIGLLTQQMHAYVDCHIEALRSAAAYSPTRVTVAPAPGTVSAFPQPHSSEVLESIPLSQVPTHVPSAVTRDDDAFEAEVQSVGGESTVKNAFKKWQHTKDTPTTTGLSPASFKSHLSHMRSENKATRSEIDSWQQKFKEMREECDQEPEYFRL